MNTIKCPYCSHENPNTNDKCEHCNKPLIIDAKQSNINLPTSNNQDYMHYTKQLIEIISGIIFTVIGIVVIIPTSKTVFKATDTINIIVSAYFSLIGIIMAIYGISRVIKGIKKTIAYYNGNLNIEKIEENRNIFGKDGEFATTMQAGAWYAGWIGITIFLITMTYEDPSSNFNIVFYIIIIIYFIIAIRRIITRRKKK